MKALKDLDAYGRKAMPTVRRGRRWSTQFSHPKVRHIVLCGHSDVAGGFPVGSYDVADVAADEEIAGSANVSLC